MEKMRVKTKKTQQTPSKLTELLWFSVSIVLGVVYLQALHDFCINYNQNYLVFIIPALAPLVTFAYLAAKNKKCASPRPLTNTQTPVKKERSKNGKA